MDDYTTLDSTTVTKEPASLNYFYSVNVDKDSIADLDGIKANLILYNKAKLDNNPKLQWFRDEKIVLKHSFKDWKGEPLFNYSITPSDK